MIRVTFDLLPGGDEARARTIGVMEIANVRTYPDNTADYAVVMKKTPPFRGALRAAWRKGLVTCADGHVNGAIAGDPQFMTGAIEGHHRARRGIYDLLFRAMLACGLAERNRGPA